MKVIHFFLYCPVFMMCIGPVAHTQNTRSPQVISYVDFSLNGSQKYVLRVDGKPFHMTNIQIRLDKLRYAWGYDVSAREALIAQAAADNFNTVSIPIHWYEVEPTKNSFRWDILDEYLGLVSKYKLKMELLWFGANSGGHVQWLGNNRTPVHLRTPDYVMYSSGPSSNQTTSDYTFRRDMSDYTLDLADNKLRAREVLILRKVMEHIASWDKSHGSKHIVIGVQLNNEVRGWNSKDFAPQLIVSYMSDLGGAVKKSPYVVWTRLNCVWGDHTSRINENEKLRESAGTNIDFVGIDLYTKDPSVIRNIMPYQGKNFRMIMECGAEVLNAAQLQVAALAGNNAYDHYDMAGPDGHELYDRNGATGFKPHGNYVEEIRTVNRLFNSDVVDLAVNAQGYGLFVHNWRGDSLAPTTGVEGVVFTPAIAASQGISISRSNTEIILMNTKGGSFTFPSTLGVTEACYGYFDAGNKWVNKGILHFTSTSVVPAAGTTVRLLHKKQYDSKILSRQAEFANYGGNVKVESKVLGFAGNGYVRLNGSGGYLEWTAINSSQAGKVQLRFRYSLDSTISKRARLIINGVSQQIEFTATGSSENFKQVSVSAMLNKGTTNTIRIESGDEVHIDIDELQILPVGGSGKDR